PHRRHRPGERPGGADAPRLVHGPLQLPGGSRRPVLALRRCDLALPVALALSRRGPGTLREASMAEHKITARSYLLVFAALLVLTFTTLGLELIDLGPWHAPVAL